jgi:hypothetical protein
MRLGPTGLIEVVSPYDAVTQAQLRAIRPAGVWLPGRRCWQFPLEAAAALELHLAGRFPMSPELAQWLVWLRQPLPPRPPHRQLVAAAAPAEPLPDGRLLYVHQRAAVRWLLARRGAVLADAMGLGKTLTSLVAARALAAAVSDDDLQAFGVMMGGAAVVVTAVSAVAAAACLPLVPDLAWKRHFGISRFATSPLQSRWCSTYTKNHLAWVASFWWTALRMLQLLRE